MAMGPPGRRAARGGSDGPGAVYGARHNGAAVVIDRGGAVADARPASHGAAVCDIRQPAGSDRPGPVCTVDRAAAGALDRGAADRCVAMCHAGGAGPTDGGRDAAGRCAVCRCGARCAAAPRRCSPGAGAAAARIAATGGGRVHTDGACGRSFAARPIWMSGRTGVVPLIAAAAGVCAAAGRPPGAWWSVTAAQLRPFVAVQRARPVAAGAGDRRATAGPGCPRRRARPAVAGADCAGRDAGCDGRKPLGAGG